MEYYWKSKGGQLKILQLLGLAISMLSCSADEFILSGGIVFDSNIQDVTIEISTGDESVVLTKSSDFELIIPRSELILVNFEIRFRNIRTNEYAIVNQHIDSALGTRINTQDLPSFDFGTIYVVKWLNLKNEPENVAKMITERTGSVSWQGSDLVDSYSILISKWNGEFWDGYVSINNILNPEFDFSEISNLSSYSVSDAPVSSTEKYLIGDFEFTQGEYQITIYGAENSPNGPFYFIHTDLNETLKFTIE
jgi:hypothetical protein